MFKSGKFASLDREISVMFDIDFGHDRSIVLYEGRKRVLFVKSRKFHSLLDAWPLIEK